MKLSGLAFVKIVRIGIARGSKNEYMEVNLNHENAKEAWELKKMLIEFQTAKMMKDL